MLVLLPVFAMNKDRPRRAAGKKREGNLKDSWIIKGKFQGLTRQMTEIDDIQPITKIEITRPIKDPDFCVFLDVLTNKMPLNQTFYKKNYEQMKTMNNNEQKKTQ